ncbi:histidine kinase/DNA gyrase B/HSP90-like ATPase [Natranaerovirga hydrolytica]|uniref:Histidine kinase/DNA gyrase B/HSP90-like ATPase n=1 Tax=Natranaerovirga hydrolytica TaxID=680378 RepID=A0A4R1N6E7_9FIRM|nr:sensor histidine kinase [Natranaerovirga hydrolytica]TCK98599.1 histidine kinase/DNA gyrase B/HSP90-like ATPase [Natranaerovirga hydrolytica]
MSRRKNNYWAKLSIRGKLLTFFFIIAFFGVIINIYLHNNNYSVMNRFNTHLNNYYDINELLVLTNENQEHLLNFLRSSNENSRIKYIETKAEIEKLIHALHIRLDEGEQYFIVNAIHYSVENYFEQWDDAIEKKIYDNNNYYTYYYNGIQVQAYTQQYIQELLNLSINEGALLYDELSSNSSFNRLLSIMVITLTFILSLIFGGFFSKYLVLPIKKLAKASSHMSKGELNVESIDVQSEDEIKVLADSFNSMSKNIKQLVEDLNEKALIEKELHKETIEKIKMQHLLQEAEFLALQSQINPHFLFNTLNTISRTAMFENANETIKLINALSSIFRFTLRKGGKIISLKEEIDMIEEYIYLQKFRFKDRLKFEIICDIDLDEVKVPFFIIQPLVENAIIHGIEPKIEGGKIWLEILKDKQYIVIKIIDSGVGISRDKLNNIIQKQDVKNTDNIGINNVYKRLQNYYNNQCGFIIKSQEGKGTSITLSFPNDKRGEADV